LQQGLHLFLQSVSWSLSVEWQLLMQSHVSLASVHAGGIGGGVGGGDEGEGGGGDGFGGDGGGFGGGESSLIFSQHVLNIGSKSGHVKPTVSAQHLTSHGTAGVNPSPQLHWLVGSFSTHVGGIGGGAGGGIGGGEGFPDGGIGGGIGGGEGEGETQHTVAAPHSLGTSGTQHLLTVAVSGANF